MSVFGIKVEYGIGDGDGPASVQRFEVALERFGDNISDFGKFVFPRVLRLFERTVDGQFQARGNGPVSGPWAPLSENYAKWKAIHFPGKPLLERTGALRSGLTSGGSSTALRGIGTTALEYGTQGVPYASFHQTGSPNLPARPPFDFGSDFEDNLRGELQLGVVEAARAENLELEK